mgnify:FL=1
MSVERRLTWWRWHEKNPHIYPLFERFCKEALGAGHQKLSAWLIVNRIRWETSVVTRDGDFKISNDFIAYYGRLFIYYNPQYHGFFSTKKLKGEDDDWWIPKDLAA